MTAHDFISKFGYEHMDRLGTIFLYLAEFSYQARLQDGKQLRDATDFRQFLRELSEAAIVAVGRSSTEVPNSAERRPAAKVTCRRSVDQTCPRCGHVHQGDRECGEQIGGGKVCRCEMEVPV